MSCYSVRNIYVWTIAACFLAGSVYSVDLNVRGPASVSVGEEFEYIVHIRNRSDEGPDMVLMYYVLPRDLELVSQEDCNPELFATEYHPEYNRVYGEGFDLGKEYEARVLIKVRAKDDIVFEHDTKTTACYFSFLVDEHEYSRRKGLEIVERPLVKVEAI